MRFAEQLLDQAQLLAKIDKTRPRQASLRRSISTAYYALFHFLTMNAAGNWKKPRQRAALARAFDHRKMKIACGRASAQRFPHSSSASGNHLRNVARTFVDLQELRHEADYDNSRVWTRTEVLEDIKLVGLAFASWQAIEGEDIAEDFLLLLLIQR
jgi:uncharacterized protein (UPF0332 family)